MRIAFHVPHARYLEPGGASGDRIFVRNLFRALDERGHEVEVVTRLNVRSLVRGRTSVRRLLTEAIAVRKAVKRFAPEAWLVYAPSGRNPDLFGWWNSPGRYVLLATNAGAGKHLPQPWRSCLGLAHRRSLARADKVVAYHPRAADSLRAFGIPENRISVLPPATELWELPSKEEARRTLELPQDVPIVLCVARLTVQEDPLRKPKKTDMVLNLIGASAGLSSEVLVVVAGEGPGRPRVEDEVARLGLGGRVRLTGRVEHEDVRRFYAACDVFAYPSIVDRPWLAVLEAQACGRPVVTMRTRSAELTVKAGSTGVLARDLDEFGSQLGTLVEDRTRCESMGEAAREYVVRHHSVARRIDQIEELLAPEGG
jgi:glycosyltransferase involved in cell wall biosynthesis